MLSRNQSNNSSNNNLTTKVDGDSTIRRRHVPRNISQSKIAVKSMEEKQSVKITGRDNNDIWNDLQLSKTNEASEWEILSNNILKRKKNWTDRNLERISEARDRKVDRAPLHLPEIRQPEPPGESLYEHSHALKDLDPALIKRSLYCFYCWNPVSVGSSRLSCRSCSSITHVNCQEQNESTDQSSADFSVNNDTRQQTTTLTWQCPECKDEIEVTSKYFQSKQETKVTLYKQAKATALLQKFCRMMIHRIRFKRLIIGIVSMQRIFRNIRNRMREALNNIHKLRPFRIRLHNIRGLIHESSTVHIEDVNEMPIILPETIFFGDIKSSTYDINFGYSARSNSLLEGNKGIDVMDDFSGPRKDSQMPRKDRLILSQAASPTNGSLHINPNLSPHKDHDMSDKESSMRFIPVPFSPKASIKLQYDSRQMNLMELLRQGCTYQPIYALPSKTVQVYNSGQMMLTIGIYTLRTHHTANNQNDKVSSSTIDTSDSVYKYSLLHRVDIPLKKIIKNEKLSIPVLQSCGIDTEELSYSSLDKLLTEYTYADFIPSRSYLMFPACTAQIIVKMYVAQVTNWPQAIIIGKFSKNIKESLIWKRTASYQSSLSDCQWIDVPANDEYNKMSLRVRRAKANKAYSSATTRSKAITNDSRLTEATISSASNRKTFATIKHEKGQYYANALVTWSVLPFNDEGENIAGMVEVRCMVRYDLLEILFSLPNLQC